MGLATTVFVGTGRQVAALDRDTGAIRWTWKSDGSSWGAGYVTLHLDGERLYVGVDGFLFCLDAMNGQVLWSNELKGFGHGVLAIATLGGSASALTAQAHAAAAAAAAAAASAS